MNRMKAGKNFIHRFSPSAVKRISVKPTTAISTEYSLTQWNQVLMSVLAGSVPVWIHTRKVSGMGMTK